MCPDMWAPLISLRPDIQLTQNQTCTVTIFQMISDLSNFLVRTHEISTFTANSQGILSSLLRFPFRKCSNNSVWHRHLLLVCGRVWGYRTPWKEPLLFERHGHECTYFSYRPRVLLLSDLDTKQEIVVALRGYYHRAHLSFCCTTYPPP